MSDERRAWVLKMLAFETLDMDTDTITRMDRRAYVRQPETTTKDVVNMLFDYTDVIHAEPIGLDEDFRETMLCVMFSDDGWRDTVEVIDVCRCAGFDVTQVVFERHEIRFTETEERGVDS